ncbi:hypothetical protein PV328_001354, partial [Microctonus aethiopoides]
MAAPSELSLSEIQKYLINNGGSARNRDLVKCFKSFLTDPETRVDARNKFKEYVNELATIKNEENEKYLVLKKKYRRNIEESVDIPHHSSSHHSTFQTSSEIQHFPSSPSSPLRDPPPYRSPPPAPSPSTDGSLSPAFFSPPEQLYATVNKPNRTAASASTDYSQQQDNKDGMNRKIIGGELMNDVEISSPPVPPRRKSQDKFKLENKENNNVKKEKYDGDITSKENVIPTPDLPSVRERMQRFNRMASETDLHGRANGLITAPTKKRTDKGADEDDSASVASQLDGKAREWLVRASQGDYQALAKLSAEEPRLTRLK